MKLLSPHPFLPVYIDSFWVVDGCYDVWKDLHQSSTSVTHQPSVWPVKWERTLNVHRHVKMRADQMLGVEVEAPIYKQVHGKIENERINLCR